jgi:hypothetical protein
MCCTHGSSVTEPTPTPANRQSYGKAATAMEPVRQKQRLAGIAETDASRAYQHADRQIKMPWLRRQRRQQQTACHQRDAQFHHGAGTEPIHQAADQRAYAGGNHEAERESARGDAALPAELIDDRRKEQRKRGAGVDADRHGDERRRDDDPTVKEGKPHQGPLLVIRSSPGMAVHDMAPNGKTLYRGGRQALPKVSSR